MDYLELGELGGLWKNVAGRYEIDGKKVYGKKILQTLKSILPTRLWQSWKRLPERPIVMDKFIRTYECFDEKTCRVIIDLFETLRKRELKIFLLPQFTQVNLKFI